MTNPWLLKTDQKGFTLTELLLVISMIGILAAISYPIFSDFSGRYSYSAAAREVMTTAMQARSNSVRDNESWQVVFDPDENEYSLVNPAGVVVATHKITSSYGNGVRLIDGAATTCGNAEQNKDGSAIAQANDFTFVGRGFSVDSLNPTVYVNRTVYLVNNKNAACLAISTTSTGVIRIRRYSGTTPYADSYWN